MADATAKTHFYSRRSQESGASKDKEFMELIYS